MPPLYARFCCPQLATTRLYQETAGITKPITIESTTNTNDAITSSSQSLATPHNTPACQQFIATGIKLERSLQNHHILDSRHTLPQIQIGRLLCFCLCLPNESLFFVCLFLNTNSTCLNLKDFVLIVAGLRCVTDHLIPNA
jgi:hypothetical protein